MSTIELTADHFDEVISTNDFLIIDFWAEWCGPCRKFGPQQRPAPIHKRHATDGAHRLYSSLGFEPEAEGFRLYLQRVPTAVQAAETTLESRPTTD